MKNDVMPSIVQMDAEELRVLTTEVKETVATGIQLPKTPRRAFTSMDMWKIQKNARSATDMLRRR